ncbi:MAG TPA: TadE family protein [Candidatus Limnocylindrales bacterium]|nr:TadE family protein [Candidatus Limnocylindrales bacterium]
MPRRHRGQSLVEMAMIAPLLIAILITTIDMGRAAYLYVTLSDAVREGTRSAIVTGPGNPTNAGVIAAVQKLAVGARLSAAACPNNQPSDPPTPPPNTGLIWVTAPASPPPTASTINAPRGQAAAAAGGGCVAVNPAPQGRYPLSVTLHYYYQPLTPILNVSFVMSFTSTMTTEY